MGRLPIKNPKGAGDIAATETGELLQGPYNGITSGHRYLSVSLVT